MSLQKLEKTVLSNYEQSLEECSKNDSGEPVTLSDQRAFNFDELSAYEAALYRRGKKLRSADALHIKNENEIFFIEFKNVRKNHVPWKSVHQKAHDSLLTLQVLLFPEISLQECAKRSSYFLVYNEMAMGERENVSPSFENFKKKIGRLAGKDDTYPVLGNMDIYEGTFYKKVYTIDVLDFEREFLREIYG